MSSFSGLTITLPRPNIKKFPKRVCVDSAFLIHPPNELPASFEQIRLNSMRFGAAIDIIIKPQVIETDEALRKFTPSERDCYFANEKKLKYFKIYTKQNCYSECASDRALEKCKCVLFHYIRNSSAPICVGLPKACARNVKQDLFEDATCQCYEPCNLISYETEIQHIKFSKTFNSKM